MTLIMSIIKPDEGVWQSADHRLTPKLKPEYDDARKQVALRCRDGSALLSYTGLAFCWPGHLATSDLIRQLLRGENRTVEGHLGVLRDGLDRYVARTGWRDRLLIIHVVAFLGSGANQDGEAIPGKPWLYEIANREKASDGSLQPTPQGRFTFKRVEVTGTVWAAGGSGEHFISGAGATELDAALMEPPGTRDLHELLATVNRRVASNLAAVSARGVRRGHSPPLGLKASTRRTIAYTASRRSMSCGQPRFLFGIDATEIFPLLVQRARLLEQGRGEADPEYQALDPVSKDVLHRMLTPPRMKAVGGPPDINRTEEVHTA